MKEASDWPVKKAPQNSPIALDEAAHRLFLGCRESAMTVVLNSDTGQETASLPGPKRLSRPIHSQPTDGRLHGFNPIGRKELATILRIRIAVDSGKRLSASIGICGSAMASQPGQTIQFVERHMRHRQCA